MSGFYIAHGGRGIYPITIGVKYTLRKKPLCSLEFKKKVKYHSLYKIRLPDRILYIANGVLRESILNMADKLDEVIQLNPWADEYQRKQFRLDYYMGNFIGDPRPAHPASKLKLLWDSGGLQLARGNTDFLDPREIGKAYKEAKIYGGVTLDLIPPKRVSDYTKATKLSASIQKLNTQYIGKEAPDTKILNVIHGYSTANRKLWLDTCYDPKYSDSWCLADISRVELLSARVGLLLRDIDNLSKKSDVKKMWLHLLGIATHKIMTVLVPISQAVGTLTADATTALISSMYGNMILPSITGSQGFRELGKPSSSDATFLPCSCPICRIVGYSWVYARFNIPLAFHNVTVINSWCSTLNNLIVEEGIDAYITYLRDRKFPTELLILIEKLWESLDCLSKFNYVPEVLDTASFRFDVPKNEKRYWKVVKRYLDFYRKEITL